MASGKYEPGPETSFDAVRSKQIARQRHSAEEQSVDLGHWGIAMHADMPSTQLHRVLAGMR